MRRKTASAIKIARRHMDKTSAYYGEAWPYTRPPLTTPKPVHELETHKECLEEYAEDVADIIMERFHGFKVRVGSRVEGQDNITMTAITPYGERFSIKYRVLALRSGMTHSLVFFVSKKQIRANKIIHRMYDIPLSATFGGTRKNFIQAHSHENLLRQLKSMENILRLLPRHRTLTASEETILDERYEG